MGTRLTKLQDEDFAKCIDYYRNVVIDKNIFTGDSESLTKTAHNIAFTMIVVIREISNTPDWAVPYLHQLRSDTIQLLPSIVWGTKRALHLFERASIEDLFRYIFFFDHRIEHLLLQTYPRKFQNFDFLIDWAKEHPSLLLHKKPTRKYCDEIATQYAELSRTIHGTTMANQQLLESLRDLGRPSPEATQETRRMKSLYGNIFFLLLLFHLKEFRQLQLDKRTLVCKRLSTEQIQVLSGLDDC